MLVSQRLALASGTPGLTPGGALLRVAALVVALGAGCRGAGGTCPTVEALDDAEDGEVHVVLDALPVQSRRTTLTLASAAARRVDGVDEPLILDLTEVRGDAHTYARRLAWGRLPPGQYVGLVITSARARVAGAQGNADLAVDDEPRLIDVPFAIEAGRASFVELELDTARSMTSRVSIAPAFAAREPSYLPELAGMFSSAANHTLTLFDRRARRPVRVVATGAGPSGIAIDQARERAYIALSVADAVEVYDLRNEELLQRIPLELGDEPAELALTPDGDVLAVVNVGSSSLSFVDPIGGAELERVDVGEQPVQLLLDRRGHRAYVINRFSNDITVVDVANRAVVRTVPTLLEPVRAAFDSDGTRLFVVHAGAPELVVYSVPELVEIERKEVGFGLATLKLDPRRDLLYIGVRDRNEVMVYDPAILEIVESIAVPAPVSYMAIDDLEDALFLLMPSRRQLVALDLTSRSIIGTLEVPCGTEHVDLMGGRR